MDETTQSYGLWSLVIINSAVFIIFAFSFFKPRTARDWRSFGAFSAFLVALFTEMYGFPLTIYVLSGWLQSRFPDVEWFSHDAGHLPEMLFGWKANPHFGPFHLLSFALIGGGFWILAAAWPVLYRAQRSGQLAKTGPYARVRHPQYDGFMLIMLGFLVQWPTMLTLAMFPVLIAMYWRLAIAEEHQATAEFGDEYRRYAARVPRFLPTFGGREEIEMKGLSGFSIAIGFAALTAMSFPGHGLAASDQPAKGMAGQMSSSGMMSEGLVMPPMVPARGRKLFASKGCVVCHSINGVGGEDAPALDASTMPSPMNPFDFAAKMWRGAEPMIYMQREELGEQIGMTGGELADIIAFVHDAAEQKKFSDEDIPSRITKLMHHMGEAEPHGHGDADEHMKGEKMKGEHMKKAD